MPGWTEVVTNPPPHALLFARVTHEAASSAGGASVKRVDLANSGKADSREWCCTKCGRITMEDHLAVLHYQERHEKSRKR